MKKNEQTKDKCGQKILIGRVVCYAYSGGLLFGEVERTTSKSVFMTDGSMVRSEKCFMVEDGWVISDD